MGGGKFAGAKDHYCCLKLWKEKIFSPFYNRSVGNAILSIT